MRCLLPFFACVAATSVFVLQADGQETPKPAGQPASRTEPPEKPAAAAEFPAPVKKNLYAGNDLRGKAAPKFAVEKWLTEEPKRDGKVVLIDFWATWCGPCRAVIPELNEFKEKFGDDLVIVGVSDEKEQVVKAFLDKTDVRYAVAIDTAAQMKKKVAVKGIPHVLILDSKGIVRWQGFPGSEEDKLTSEVIQQVIDADKAARANDASPAEATPPASVTEPGETPAPAPKP